MLSVHRHDSLTEGGRLVRGEVLADPVGEDVLPGPDDDGPPLRRLLQVAEGDAVLDGRLGDLDLVLDVVDQEADLLVEPILLQGYMYI